MNPGAAEEIGKATGGFIDALRSQPLALALCVMNLALLAILFYIAKVANDTRREGMTMQREINQLLARCVVPPNTQFKLQSDESKPAELEPAPEPK